MRYSIEAKENYCPTCEYYEECTETEMCNEGYWEYLEDKINKIDQAIQKWKNSIHISEGGCYCDKNILREAIK